MKESNNELDIIKKSCHNHAKKSLLIKTATNILATIIQMERHDKQINISKKIKYLPDYKTIIISQANEVIMSCQKKK